MYKRICLLLAIAFLYTLMAPGAFGTSLLYVCSPTLELTTSDLIDHCPGATGVPTDASVTSVKLYLVADFQGGAPGVWDGVAVLFDPINTSATWTGTNLCTLTNGGSGSVSTTNTCGFYSGTLTAPGTSYLVAESNWAGLATNGFDVMAVRADYPGTGFVSYVRAYNVVEYTYTPEAPTMLLFSTALVALGWFSRRHPKLLPVRTRNHSG